MTDKQKKDEADPPGVHAITEGPAPARSWWRPRRLTASAYENARPPALPVGIIQTLEEYYVAAVLIGVVAAQGDEPPKEDMVDWAIDVGVMAARKVKERGFR